MDLQSMLKSGRSEISYPQGSATATGRMNLPARVKASRLKAMLSFLCSPLSVLSPEDAPPFRIELKKPPQEWPQWLGF